ncbi:hypothetical protein B0J13DRAFT_564027 [Dactylonectria estremocensis]|uniref:Uncharacterized protein n=1 Tax=Dactylonectria estremocensis TaxID=1079267 RepID=A0A9P9E1N2_9HYPO|nr:hypothetical protein B0J13DRAFT_564027 [Dactylonectria estremocensis]
MRRTATVSRRPHGPRAMGSNPNVNTDKPLPAFPPPPQIEEEQERVAFSPPPQSDERERVPAHASAPGRKTYASRSPSPRKGETSFTNPFTLALIRRDPSTGNQWNVGHVSSYQSEAPAVEQDESGPFIPTVPAISSTTPAANPPINIQIETLGYGRFRNMPARRSFDIGPGDGIPPDAQAPRNDDAVLSRQVLMSYAKTWGSNWREKWNQESRGEHRRHGSVASVESAGSVEHVPEPQTVLGQPGPGMRPRGYVFTSPWNGRCEFRTGTTGRTLKCYHILKEDRPALNTLVDQGVPVPQQLGHSMAVSELRFNLPSVELFKSAEGREEVKTQIQGHFNKLLQKLDERTNRNNDYDDGMVSPFDVNLGKEKAGGGNRGKRAKMGKLIIYPDGLKMLDLVVAANMGVWWGVWEKSF